MFYIYIHIYIAEGLCCTAVSVLHRILKGKEQMQKHLCFGLMGKFLVLPLYMV